MQITIPKAIAAKLRIKVGEQVQVKESNGRVVVTQYKNLVEELAGSLKVPSEAVNAHIAKRRKK